MSLDKQLALEKRMIDLGTEKYENSVDTGDEFESTHIQSIISGIIKPFGENINAHVTHDINNPKQGAKPPLVQLSSLISTQKKRTDNDGNEIIKNVPLSVLQMSFITVRTAFNTLRKKPHKLVRLSSEIGNALNSNLLHDQRMADQMSFRCGVGLVELFIAQFPMLVECKFVYPEKDSRFEEYMIYPTDEYVELSERLVDEIAEMTTVMLPMVFKPVEWDSTGSGGGFYTDSLKTNIIKRKRVDEDSNINSLIANSTNLIQGTPWKVNVDAMCVIDDLNKTQPPSLDKLYPKEIDVDPVRPFSDELKYSDMNDDDKKLHQKWSRTCRRNDKKRTARDSVGLSRFNTMKQAQEFKKEDHIFFPHDLDYRDRLYNKCMTGLNTQGSDGQKGLIHLGNARPVSSPDGVRWMAINMANLAGHDKLKLDERRDWTISNEALIRDVVKDPIKCDLWHSWDKPVQGLAAAMDYVKWLDDPDTPLRTHVQLDGLCNGVQNLAAITRDHEVAPHVGLIQTDLRGDVYQYVCDEVIGNITNSSNPLAVEWLTSMLLGRKIAKGPVMTRSYAAKLYGVKEGIQDFIEDSGMEHHFTDYFKAGNWMGERIWECMDESLKGPMAFMQWVQECAGVMASANKPLIWTNPVGGVCTQSPFTTKATRIKVNINGSRKDYQIRQPTNKINRAKMMASSSPNVIHSCDASHLMLTVDKCHKDGINEFAMVHDSFGCHPDDAGRLLYNAKEAWVEIYSKNWMEIWYEQWCSQLGTNDLPKPSEFVTMGSLDVRDVRKSDFFFA